MKRSITCCATGKTGLGHLRRLTNIVAELKQQKPNVSVNLLCNATPAGLTEDESALYATMEQFSRSDMVKALAERNDSVVVVDTAVIPDLQTLQARLCLVLRETAARKVRRFRLQQDRAWDLVVLPNPKHDWWPRAGDLNAPSMHAVGWIYRASARASVRSRSGNGVRQLMVTAGGGGNSETAEYFRALLDSQLNALARVAKCPYEIVQVLGPRAPACMRLPYADRIIPSNAQLNTLFPDADLVISTAGYNSVLELAATDVPVLLAAIPRSIDDQTARARRWGARLGRCCHAQGTMETAQWMAETLASGRRRPPIELGSNGAFEAARLILRQLEQATQ